MAYTQTGLPNRGNTSRYEIHYDTSLSVARGVTLANDLMDVCDSDYQWLKAYFPTATVGPPGSRIRIWIDTVTNPRDFLGASWAGYGLIPFDVHIMLGQMPVSVMRAVDAVRWLIVCEVSEMLMRERQGFGSWNDWFALQDEGSKGESLSNVFGVEFIRTQLRGVKLIPGMSRSSDWLKVTGRPDFVSVNVDNILPGPETGCGIQFLMYLRDQLDFSLDQIIASGASTFADVYHNLTGDAAGNAYTRFVDLVNLHYPPVDGPYDPPLETSFPVPSLTGVYVDSKVSWISNGRSPVLLFEFDHPIVSQTTVHFSSDTPSVIALPATKRLTPSTASLFVELQVKPQAPPFARQIVTLTTTYAGRSMPLEVTVVPPSDLLPALKIESVSDGDRCRRLYEAGSAITLYVSNIDVFADRQALKYTWTVQGARADALNTPQITIQQLPGAGTSITVTVAVDNGAGLVAKGQLDINVREPLSSLEELDRRVRCKIASMPAINAHIPPWVPITKGPLSREHIAVVKELLQTSIETLSEAQKLVARLDERRSKEASIR